MATSLRYVLYAVDSRMDGAWTNKFTYLFYLELVSEVVKLVVYLVRQLHEILYVVALGSDAHRRLLLSVCIDVDLFHADLRVLWHATAHRA